MLFLAFYFLDGALNLFAENAGITWLSFSTKVLLMPLLMLFLWRKRGIIKEHKFIFAALFFSWLGDIFLMFPRNEYSQTLKEQLFISGLVAFLLAHLNYIVSFIKDIYNIPKTSIIVEKPYLIWPFAIYLFFILKFLWPHLGSMKFPVLLYGLCIAAMFLAAFNRKNIIADTSFYLVLVGAALFLISDSCLSVTIFYKRFTLDRFIVMLTYIAGQGLIVLGVSETQLSKEVISHSSSRCRSSRAA